MQDVRRSWKRSAGNGLLLAFAAASCSGSGGGSSALSGTFSSAPSAGALDVAPDVMVRVQLPLPPGPVQASWLRLSRDGVAGSGGLTEDGEVLPGVLTREAGALLFEPDSRLHLLAEHTITLAVPGSTHDSFGFSVRDGAWSAPFELADELRVVDLAADGDRGVWVCMLTTPAPLSRLALVYVDRDGVVGPFTWFANDKSVERAKLAVDTEGMVLVVAARRASGGTYRVWTAARPADANAWGPFLPLSSDSTIAPLVHACFARAGQAVVAWEIGNTRDLWHAVFDSGAGWSEPVALEPEDTAAEALSLASGESGRVVAVWRTLPGELLESRVFDSDGSERALRVFEPFGCCVGEPRVALAGGRALAVWRAEESLLLSWIDDEEWSAALPIAFEDAGTLEGPLCVGLSEVGIGHVAWVAGGLLRARRVDASGVMGPTVVLSTPNGSPSSPVLSVDPLGNALCVWDELSSAEPGKGVFAARALASGGWGLAQPLELVAGECSVSPRLGGTPGGSAWAGWTTTVGCDFTLGFRVSLSRFD